MKKLILTILLSPFFLFSQCIDEIIYNTDFEGPTGIEWNNNTTLFYNYTNTNVLGNFNNNAAELYLNNLPTHQSITVEFDLYIFDSWDGYVGGNGEIWSLLVDGAPLINTSFSNNGCNNNQAYPDDIPNLNPDYSGATETFMPNISYSDNTNPCPPAPNNNSALYTITQTINHTNNDMSVVFTANNLESITNESWAIDNVVIIITDCSVYGCTSPLGCNYNESATNDDGSCIFTEACEGCSGEIDGTGTIVSNDADGDGVCDDDEIEGCMDSNYLEYNPLATNDNGSCATLIINGCINPNACNFDAIANTDDGSCQICASREFNDGAYLDVDSEIINAQGITISFWVNDTDFCENPEDFATYIDFGSQDSYRYVVRNRSCKIEAFFEGDMLPTEFDWGTMDWGYPKASAAGSLVPNGEQTGWRQVTTVFCPTTIRIYVDGEIVASNGTGVYFQEGFNLFTDDVKRIGSNQVDYEPANAMIDEVRIWNRALSGEEVLARAGGATTLNIDEELNLNGYWQMDCANPLLNQVTGQLGSDNLSLANENFNGNNCETSPEYNYECSLDFEGNPDCNSCDPPEGCTDEEACNYDYLAVISIPGSCFYVLDYCPNFEYPEYYDCDCKCINDSDSDDVCDELEVEGCSEDEGACNYNPEGTEPCVYPEDEFGVTYVDCEGGCLNDIDGDGVCDEEDNCVDVYNPNQEDLNDDGIGDDCDGVGLEEGVVAKELIKVTDVLGRETQKQTKGSTLMYWYNTGEVEINYIF